MTRIEYASAATRNTRTPIASPRDAANTFTNMFPVSRVIRIRSGAPWISFMTDLSFDPGLRLSTSRSRLDREKNAASEPEKYAESASSTIRGSRCRSREASMGPAQDIARDCLCRERYDRRSVAAISTRESVRFTFWRKT